MRTILAAAMAVAALLSGCGNTTGASAPYIGTWKSQHAELTVTPTERMNYHRDESDTRVEENYFNVPIKEISGKEIIGAVEDARLEISEPPHQTGATWQMTLNGDVLTKQ